MVGFELTRGILTVTPETWGYLPFKKILDRDKTEDKEYALQEMLFIYHYISVGSDYEFIKDDKERGDTIRKDLGMPKKWKIDKTMTTAIAFYKHRSDTVLTELYRAAISSIQAISQYLDNTEALLAERDKNDRPIHKINDITNALKNVKVIMRDVKDAYKEVVKESKADNKNVGKQEFNVFEEGLEIENI